MRPIREGQVVNCPADRGDAPYRGPVAHVSETVHTNIHGVDYQWVTVADQRGNRHVWPSHRLQ